MDARTAIISVLPEIEGLDEVDFSQYASQYLPLVKAFAESGGRGLGEFENFVKRNGLEVSVVGNFLISLFQYLLIRYRRYGEYSVVKPAVKTFITLKGWLNENGFEREWELLLHNFVGYLVDMMAEIEKNEDCETALSYLTVIYRLAVEASESFAEEYFERLAETAERGLDSLRERCGSAGSAFKKEVKGC